MGAVTGFGENSAKAKELLIVVEEAAKLITEADLDDVEAEDIAVLIAGMQVTATRALAHATLAVAFATMHT